MTLNKSRLLFTMWVGLIQSLEGLRNNLEFPQKEGILYQDCKIESLLPCTIQTQDCNISSLSEFSVGWAAPQIVTHTSPHNHGSQFHKMNQSLSLSIYTHTQSNLLHWIYTFHYISYILHVFLHTIYLCYNTLYNINEHI